MEGDDDAGWREVLAIVQSRTPGREKEEKAAQALEFKVGAHFINAGSGVHQ